MSQSARAKLLQVGIAAKSLKKPGTSAKARVVLVNRLIEATTLSEGGDRHESEELDLVRSICDSLHKQTLLPSLIKLMQEPITPSDLSPQMASLSLLSNLTRFPVEAAQFIKVNGAAALFGLAAQAGDKLPSAAPSPAPSTVTPTAATAATASEGKSEAKKNKKKKKKKTGGASTTAAATTATTDDTATDNENPVAAKETKTPSFIDDEDDDYADSTPAETPAAGKKSVSAASTAITSSTTSVTALGKNGRKQLSQLDGILLFVSRVLSNLTRATGLSDAQLSPLYSHDFFATLAFTLHSNSPEVLNQSYETVASLLGGPHIFTQKARRSEILVQALGRSLTVGTMTDMSEELVNMRGRIIYLVNQLTNDFGGRLKTPDNRDYPLDDIDKETDDVIKARALSAFVGGGGLARCIELAATLVPTDTKSSDSKIITTESTVFRQPVNFPTQLQTGCFLLIARMAIHTVTVQELLDTPNAGKVLLGVARSANIHPQVKWYVLNTLCNLVHLPLSVWESMMPDLLETLLIAAKEEIRETNKDSFEQRTLCIGGLANMCAGHDLCRSIQKHGALDFVLQWLRTSMESLSRGEQSLNELALHATRFVCNLVTNAASEDLVTWLFVKRTPGAVAITTGGGVEVYRDFDVPVYDVVKGIMSVKGLSATIRSFAVQTLNILGRLKATGRNKPSAADQASSSAEPKIVVPAASAASAAPVEITSAATAVPSTTASPFSHLLSAALNQTAGVSSGPVVCHTCGEVSTKSCSKCFAVHYCSREHQMADWSRHKKECEKVGLHRKMAALSAVAGAATPTPTPSS